MRIHFRWVATIFAVFLWVVALNWMLFPALLLDMWDLPNDPAEQTLGLRVAGLVLGWGVALFLARRQPPSPARRAISYGSASANAAAAAGGVYSVMAGLAGTGVLLPVVIEVVAAAAFILAERAHQDADLARA